MEQPPPSAATAPPLYAAQPSQAQDAAQGVPDDGSMEAAETAQPSTGSGGGPASAGAAAGAAAPARVAQLKKHHLLRHALSDDAKAAAVRHFGGSLPEESAARIVRLQQRELREAFAAVYGVQTSSCNNGWMRGKLLQALGLSPHWQPPRDESADPTPPPARPAAEPGAEVSRYGRRVQRTRWAGGESGDDAEPSPRGSSGGGGKRGGKALATAASSASTKRARASTSPRAVTSLPAGGLPAFSLAGNDSPALLGGWPSMPPQPLAQPFVGAFSQPHVRIVMANAPTAGGADAAAAARRQRGMVVGPLAPLPPSHGGAQQHPPAAYQQPAAAPHGLSRFQAPPAWSAPPPPADPQAALRPAGLSLHDSSLRAGGSMGERSLPYAGGLLHPSGNSVGGAALAPAGVLRSAGNSFGEGPLPMQSSMPGDPHMLSVAVLEEQQRLYELKRQQLELEKQALELELHQEQQRRQLQQQQQQLALLQQQRVRELRAMAAAAATAYAAPHYPPVGSAPLDASLFAPLMPPAQPQQPAMGGADWASGAAPEPRCASAPPPATDSWDPWAVPVGTYAAESTVGVLQGGQAPPAGFASCRPEPHPLFPSFEDSHNNQAGMAVRGLV